MSVKKCNFCGSTEYEERRTDYLYSHNGHYLLVHEVPVEICSVCGMIYYPAKVLKDIEQRFFEIHGKLKKPKEIIQMPVEMYD